MDIDEDIDLTIFEEYFKGPLENISTPSHCLMDSSLECAPIHNTASTSLSSDPIKDLARISSYSSSDTLDDTSNFSTIFDRPLMSTSSAYDKTVVKSANNSYKQDIKKSGSPVTSRVALSTTSTSRKRSLPLETNASNNNFVQNHSKDDLISSAPIKAIKSDTKQILSSVSSSFTSKEEELLKRLMNSKLASSDDEEDFDQGDDDELEEGADGFASGSSDRKKKRGRKATFNPDTALINAAIDAHMKKMNLDPNSKDGKRERRRLRNRLSAQLHRDRKRLYIEDLEAKIKDRDVTIEKLTTEMKQLRNENESLRLKHGLVSRQYLSDGSTSDEDNESTSSKSTRSNSSYRLLSVIILFCFGIYGLRPDNSFESALSTAILDPELGSMLAKWSLPQLPAPDAETVSQEWSNEQAISHRKLLTLLDETANYATKTSISKDETLVNSPISLIPSVLTLPAVTNEPSKSIVTSSNAMWKYQSHVLQLYPHLQSATRQNISDSAKSQERKFLRARRNSGIPSDSNSSKVGSMVYVPSFGSEVLNSQSSLSRVLVTEGKTLLDPSLTCKSSLVNPMYSSPSSDSSETSSSSTDNTATSTALTIRSEAALTPATDSPKLLIMLPAKSVRWGKSWTESTANPMEWMSRSQNATGENIERDVDSATADLEDLWVEIGCSVYRAQVVRNVTLSK